MFHDWPHPQIFCRHQTQHNQQLHVVQTTMILHVHVSAKRMFFGVLEQVNKKPFVSIDLHDHKNTYRLTKIAVNGIDVYHSFLTRLLEKPAKHTISVWHVLENMGMARKIFN